MELLNVGTLEALVKIFGKIVLIDEKYLNAMDKRVARLLVEVDISKGLVLEFKLVWRNKVFTQKVQYWRAPFRCIFCI